MRFQASRITPAMVRLAVPYGTGTMNTGVSDTPRPMALRHRSMNSRLAAS